MKRFKTVLCVLFFGAMIIVLLYMTLRPIPAKLNTEHFDDLAGAALSEGTYVEGTAHFASGEFLEVKHTVNFIPTGYDHFFLIFSEDMNRCVVVRADKDWAEEFSEEGFGENAPVSGFVKDLDHDVQKELLSITQQADYPLTAAGYYIDTLAYRYALFTILAVAAAVGAGLGIFFLLKKGAQRSLWAKLLYIVILADMCFIIHILAMLG